MIKKLLLLAPILLLSSCTTITYRYDNVETNYEVDQFRYVVRLNEKDYIVKVDATKIVMVHDYPLCNDNSGNLAYNSFYINKRNNNESYCLVFYKVK